MTSVKMGNEEVELTPQKVTSGDADTAEKDDGGGAADVEAQEKPQQHIISIYQETRECLNWATFAYIIAEYRVWSKDGKLKDNQAAFSLPLTVPDLRNITSENVEFIQDTIDKDRVKLINNILTYMESNQKGEDPTSSVQIVVFEDSRQGNDMVYFIAVNHVRKTIHLVFRGTVTLADLYADIRAVTWYVPVENVPDQNTVTVHKGFYDYLFGKLESTESGRYVTAESGIVIKEEESVVKDKGEGGGIEVDASNTSARSNENRTTKYDIIKEQLLAILAEHPDYELYVTGTPTMIFVKYGVTVSFVSFSPLSRLRHIHSGRSLSWGSSMRK